MITSPNKPTIIEESDVRGVFEVTACYPGYGIILGNAIRRVLLSSLPGSAITDIKIKGVQHEFSTVPGVMEDVVQIILNLKQIRFRLNADFEEERAFHIKLNAKGEKKVKAGDIKTGSEIEVVNKDAHIAALTDRKAELEIEMEVGCGFGYSPVEERKSGKLETGKIAIDAIFSPIHKVNYSVEDMRVGDKTNYGRLRFNVETDGTITPKDAFLAAIDILVKQYKEISSFGEKKKAKKKKAGQKEKKAGKPKEAPAKPAMSAKDIKIKDLKVSSRVISILDEAGFKTVAGLIRKNEEDLKKIEGLGDKGITEIKRTVGKFGLILKK